MEKNAEELLYTLVTAALMKEAGMLSQLGKKMKHYYNKATGSAAGADKRYARQWYGGGTRPGGRSETAALQSRAAQFRREGQESLVGSSSYRSAREVLRAAQEARRRGAGAASRLPG